MGRSRAGRRATIGLALVSLLALGGSALAELRDRAVQRWIHAVEGSLHVLRDAVPEPRPAPAAAPVALASSYRPRRSRTHAAVPVVLTGDERLDLVRASFCPRAAQLLCRARTRCGCVTAETDCEMRVEAACTDGLFLNFEIQSENEELDPIVLDRCLAGLEALPTHCQLPSAVVHGCAWPVRDIAPRGEACASQEGRCRGGVCDAEGTCVAAPGLGERTPDATCAMSLVAVHRRCVPAGGLGGECFDYHQCGDGQYDCVGGRCVSRPPAGHACQSSPECDAGLACIDEHCRPAPTWCDDETDCGSEQACEHPSAACVRCEPGVDCSGPVRCVGGARCDPGQQCGDPPETGRCGPELCGVDRLEGLFEELR